MKTSIAAMALLLSFLDAINGDGHITVIDKTCSVRSECFSPCRITRCDGYNCKDGKCNCFFCGLPRFGHTGG
uniref:Venom peptide HtKTx2 n=1 Tax=Hadogenes troglodytes TaxID=1577150 RepID=A0A1B3IJ18_9SCOR|nr:venom peptide HtKTx2 [Hadogenes troglodytes]